MIDQRVRGVARPASFAPNSPAHVPRPRVPARRAYGPPPAGVPQVPSWVPRPPVPPPTRVTGIVVSWAVFVVLGLVALSGYLGTAVARVDDAKPTTTFVAGQVLNVSIDPADKPAIYVAAGRPARVGCAISGGGQLESAGGTTVTANGTRWELGFRINVPAPGTYQVRCRGDAVTFGIGKEPADNVVWVVLLIVLPGLGFVAAVVTTVIVIGKRRADRFDAHAALYAPR